MRLLLTSSTPMPPHHHPVAEALVLLVVVLFAVMLGVLWVRARRRNWLLEERSAQLRAVAEHIPGVVYSYEYHPDRPRKVLFLGPGLAELVGPETARKVEERYDHIFELLHPADRERLRDEVDVSARSDRPVDVELRLKNDGGEYVWIRTISRSTEIGGGVSRWHGVLVDISAAKRVEDALRQNEAAIRALYEATAGMETGAEDRIARLLEVGREIFGLEVGILAQVEGDRYTIVECVAPADLAIRPGDEFALGETFCRETLVAEGPVSFEHAASSRYAGHPAYRKFGLEAYCGAPVIVQGGVFGTVNFSSRAPRRTPFASWELDLLRLMARWLGGEIERDNARRELQWAHDNLEHEVRQRTAELLATNRALREQVVERELAETELQQKRRQERLLFSELDHRVRNNLSSLVSLLDMTRRQSTDMDDLVASIRGRIEAMAAIHSMLSKAHWTVMNLHELIAALSPVRMERSIEVVGDEVEISARQANAFGMVLHELIANSMKYGALSRPGGRIGIEWTVTGVEDRVRHLNLTWVERGGPPIAPSIRPGAGTTIIEGLVRFELRGAATLSFPSSGAEHRFSMILDDSTDAEKANRQFAQGGWT